MKKVYNYITIVKDGSELKLGKNCGISCNRRNTMDKAHNRPTEIIAAINFPFMNESTIDKIIKAMPQMPMFMTGVSMYGHGDKEHNDWCISWTLDHIEILGKRACRNAYCEKHLNPPTRWGY